MTGTKTIPIQSATSASTATGGALSCRVKSAILSGAGPGAPTFALVHGIGMSHRYFDRLQTELSKHGHVYVLDLPGFGGTPRPEKQLQVSEYASAIGTALDAAGVSSCVLVGHSMGAQFVTELALQRPGLVSELVLIGPVTDATRRSVLWHSLTLALDSLKELPLTNTMVLTDYARCGLPWYLTELSVMLRYRLHERLPLATQLVLVIRGSEDPVSRRSWCARLADSAKDGKLVEIPGQPHVAHRGGARQVAHAILAFLPSARQASSPAEHAPAQDLQQRQAILTRYSTVHSRGGNASPIWDVTDLHSIKVGDRQCRAYPLIRAASDTPNQSAESATPRRLFVFIHGIGMSHRYFRRLAAALADHGDSYLIDLPGYGWTHRPAEKLTNPANAELIGALLDEIGAGPYIVVGHSMGVQSATELAIERPDLVSRLVLIGAAIDAKERTVLRQAPRLVFNSLLERPLLNCSQFLDVLRCGPRWYMTELAVAMAYKLEERLPLAEQPVLIMRGTQDPIAGSCWSQSLADSAQSGELSEISGSPHAVHHSNPDAVAARIIDFLRRFEHSYIQG